MSKPTLIVIAGCNGSGKSSFSKAISPPDTEVFDYDKVFLKNYNNLRDSELKDRMAHNQSRGELEHQIKLAIAEKRNFCYETNFNSTPLFWPEKFKENNYNLELIFFCLDSVEEAKKRVAIRVENGGHFVPDHEVELRFNLGYIHLNKHWSYFDSVQLFNTSTYKSSPRHILSFQQASLVQTNDYPKFLLEKIPDLVKALKKI